MSLLENIIISIIVISLSKNALTMLQKTILKDRAVVDIFKAMLGAVTPVQGIVGEN